MSVLPSLARSNDSQPTTAATGRRKGSRRTLVAILVVGTAGAGVAAYLVAPLDRQAKADDTSDKTPISTAIVKRGTISARTSVNGTLAYAGSYEAIGQASGVVTGVPGAGDLRRAGQVLYEVNGKPVILLKGSIPVFRDLKQGDKGADVKQLNAALVKLGYSSYLSASSSYYGYLTKAAVKKMEDDFGLEEDGKLSMGEVVYLPQDKVKVTKVNVKIGGQAQPGMAVLTASSLRRYVSVQIDTAYQSQVKPGDKVTITLPNLKTTAGKVTSVGRVAEAGSDNQGAKVTVGIEPADPKATGSLDQAPVQVSIITDSARNVLNVPVNSLLALLDGGYGVEVVGSGGERRLVPVKLGMFDQDAGIVEVTGAGLKAGQQIVVPAS
ncbi:peptidoglycan-binding protein [Kribbella solani]|uniref:Peptidoglycan hydrolase-like protein with peptidoglycan-binding domain n=1 Tax=Kribbella solani TaxID=236067 RepID=A0A841DWL9_9ACTN|nr:peptidoglycan-binding protein [Kribbella solani]MBB5982519.1 peptidoglycan hydrolase-like protein with peptidoglycan-binding domain [Kribbella solani]